MMHLAAMCLAYFLPVPSRLHINAYPDWVQDAAMPYRVVLWALCPAGMLNLLTVLPGAWGKLLTDPVLRFLVAAVAIKASTSPCMLPARRLFTCTPAHLAGEPF